MPLGFLSLAGSAAGAMGGGGMTNGANSPINGGAATNGDQTNKIGANFGANRFGAVTLNKNNGLDTRYLIAGAVVLAGVWLYANKGKRKR